MNPSPEIPATLSRNPRRIFISHASQDAEFAHRLADDLKKQGWLVWIAPDSIRPGKKWVTAIDEGLDSSGVFLAVLTPSAIRSKWVQHETVSAIALENKGKIRLFTLLLQLCDVPTLLQAYQHIPFVEDYSAGFAQLVGALAQSQSESTFHPDLERVPAGEPHVTHNEQPAPSDALFVGVPARPINFVGREALLADIVQRLTRGEDPALSSEGLPGVGKTTMAIAVAYDAAIRQHFNAGVLWAGLGTAPDLMGILAQWAQALGLDVSRLADETARAQAVRDTIGQRHF